MRDEHADRIMLGAITELADSALPSADQLLEEQRLARERIFGSTARRRRIARPVMYATVGIALLGVTAGTATGVLRFEPSPEEVDSLAADRGVSTEAARKQLLDEHGLPELETSLRAKLSARFAGLWVDNGQITVGVVGPLNEADRRAVDSAATRASIAPGAAVIAERERSERSMLDLLAHLQLKIEGANQGSRRAIEVEPDIRWGTVIVRRPAASLATKTQTRFIDALSRYGTAVVIAASTPEPQNLMSSRAERPEPVPLGSTTP